MDAISATELQPFNNHTGVEGANLAKSRGSFNQQDIEAALPSRGEGHVIHVPDSLIPNHYDPLHPVVVANNTFSDTLVYATLVSDVFKLPVENCIAAGIAGNLAFALATSPYISSKVMALLPNDSSRDTARGLDKLVRTFIDPGYMAYYTTAWPALGVATIPEACCFILASALMRKGASLLLQSEMCKGSFEEQAKALTSTDQVLQPSLRALVRVMRDFAPDLVAALSRSGVSNVYAYQQGKNSADDVFKKTLFSGAVYIVATFLYYACYRGLEQLGSRASGIYQKPAAIDEEKVKSLQKSLKAFEPHAGQVDANSSVQDEASQRLVSTSHRDFHSSLVREQSEAFSKSFEFLKSPLVSLYKDPLYRSAVELSYYYRQDPDSKKAIEAFDAIDATDLLGKVVASLEGDAAAESQLNAYKILLRYLGVEVPSHRIESQDVQAIQEKGMDALIEMFQRNRPTTSQSQKSLLMVAQAHHPGYGAVTDSEEKE